MPAPVVVDFILRGMPDVTRAFRTIEQAAAASERAQTSATTRASTQRQRSVEREARDKVRSMLKVDREVTRIQDRAAREAAKAAQTRTRAEQREMQNLVREAEKSAQARIRIEQRVDREFASMRRRQERERDRAVREDERRQTRAARADERKRGRDRASDDKSTARWQRGIGQGVVSGVSKGAGAIVHGTARAAGMFAQLGGGFSIADSVREESELQRSAALLSNQAFIPGKTARPDTKAIVAQAKATARSTGTDANDVINATRTFVNKTGDYKNAVANQEFFAKVGKATGSDMQDVARTAGMLQVQNKNMSPEVMRQTLLTAMMQSNQGAVEFSQLAQAGGKLTRTSTGYVGDQAANQSELMGLAQFGIRTAGNVNEAATMQANVMQDAMKHPKDIKGLLGDGVFNEKGQITSGPAEFLTKVMGASGGNLQKIMGAGFGARSLKMFQALAPEYNEHEAEGLKRFGGDKKKAAAYAQENLLKDIKQITGKQYGEENLDKDMKVVLDSTAEQFEKVMRELKMAVGEQLLPEFLKLVPVLRDAMPMLQRLVGTFASMTEWAATNPIKAIFAVLTASIAKEVAAAGMGQAIGKALETSLGQKGGLVVASGAIAVTAASIIVESIATKHAAEVTRDVSGSTNAFAQASGVRVGDAGSQETLDNLIAQRDSLTSKVDEQRKNVNSKDAIEYVGMAGKLASITPVGYAAQKLSGEDLSDSDQSEAYQRQRQQRLEQNEQALEALNKAIMIAAGNLKTLGKDGAVGGAPGGTSGATGNARGTGIGQRTQ